MTLRSARDSVMRKTRRWVIATAPEYGRRPFGITTDASISTSPRLQVQPNWIGVVQSEGHRQLRFASAGKETHGTTLTTDTVQLRMHVADQAVRYEYSLDDGNTFKALGDKSTMRFSWWKGARPALFSYTTDSTATKGHVDVDWVRIRQLAPERRVTSLVRSP